MVIKQLNKSYLNELVKLDGLAFKPLVKKLSRHSSTDAKEYFIFTFKKGKLFGYFVGNELVGCIGIVINKKHKYAEIEHLLVNPKYQRQGIATRLIKFIENYTKNKKIKNLRLNVRCKNMAAFNLYKKLGYLEHAYIMIKKLK
jgi:ribosomal protein S18 acetylase RimI-like enzyme